MKKLTSLALMIAGVVAMSGCVTEVTQGPPPPEPVVAVAPVELSPGAAEVARLAQAGTGEDVMLAYVQNAGAPFALNSDQIVYLRNNGVSSAVLTAMINRDAALGQGYAAAPAPVAPPPAAPAEPPPVYVSSPPADVSYFYDDLSPYGSWAQLDGVGWCWQPQVVAASPNWRPYCDSGHWLYTDAGWYWQSDYPWGWAPFHYGRWQLHERCGWVWVPDRVWGPSWVVWRNEADHCGWAPLPPHADFDARLGWRFNGVRVAVDFDFGLRPDHFTFVKFGDFNARDLDHRRLDRPEVTRIYNHTTIINNYVVQNNTVINHGIQVERVAAATHTQLRPVPIRSGPAGSRVATPGGEVAYRTELKAPARGSSAMVAQKIDDRHPVIAHASPETRPLPTRQLHTTPASQTAQTEPKATPAPARYQPPSTNTPRTPNAPGRVAEQPKPATRPATAATPPKAPTTAVNRPGVAPKPVSRTTTAFLPAPKPAAARTWLAENQAAPNPAGGGNRGQLHPLQISVENPAGKDSQSTHFYQPKSARQAADAHSLSPANAPRPKSSAPNGGKAQPKRAE